MEQFVFSVVTGIPFFVGMQYASHWYWVRQDPKARLSDSRFGVGIAVLALPACWLMHEPRVQLLAVLAALAIATGWIYWRDRRLAQRQTAARGRELFEVLRSSRMAGQLGPVELLKVVTAEEAPSRGNVAEVTELPVDLSRAGEVWPDLGGPGKPLL